MGVYTSSKPNKDGRKYYFKVGYKDVYGNYKIYASKNYLTKKEAKQEEALYRIKINELKTDNNNITLIQAYYEFENDKSLKVKKQTLNRDKNLFKHLEPLHDKKINDITLPLYQKYKLELDKSPLTNDYKNKILGLFKAIVNYSFKYHGTSDYIVKFVENYRNVNVFKKEMDFFTLEEYRKFRSVISNDRWACFFDCLFYLGLRQGELQALTWNDISFTKKEVSITKTLTTKIKGELWTISTPKTKNSTRTLPLTETLLNELKNMQKEANKYINYSSGWFVFGNSVPFKETTIQKYKNSYCDKANLRRIRVHDFRHSCASLLINQGASINLVSKYLGHSNITITLNTYTHLYNSELLEMSSILNNLK